MNQVGGDLRRQALFPATESQTLYKYGFPGFTDFRDSGLVYLMWDSSIFIFILKSM